ncbi:unnamed protein product [Mytilus edulis]|uniref:Uncharacterized protein n=1 Tax=Mytilus edulis TaxID=6550 RepID=A0A8S3SEK0_MYTED|nr:unnamed protein product [Mytilus edulis]
MLPKANLGPNYGNKENSEALKEPVDKCLIEAKEQAYQSVLSILDTRVQELNSTISTVLNTGISYFDINSPPSGEARTKLAKEANNMNEEYTLKLRKFVTDMRNKSRSNNDSPSGPTRERDERRTPYSRNERRDKTPKNRSKQRDNDYKNNDLIKRYDACVNDCLLFCKTSDNDHSLDRECTKCGELRYKAESLSARKTFTYMPIGPRLSRIFGSDNICKILYSRQDLCNGKLTDITDGKIYKSWCEDGGVFQNMEESCTVPLALFCDGLNPHKSMATPKSMWPLILTWLNLPVNIRNIFIIDYHNVVLDPLVLEVAMRNGNDMIAQPPEKDYNRCHRHTAYRRYVLRIHISWIWEQTKNSKLLCLGSQERFPRPIWPIRWIFSKCKERGIFHVLAKRYVQRVLDICADYAYIEVLFQCEKVMCYAINLKPTGRLSFTRMGYYEQCSSDR